MPTPKLAFMFGFAALFAGCTSTSVSPDHKVDHTTAAVLLYNANDVILASGESSNWRYPNGWSAPALPISDAYVTPGAQRITFFVQRGGSRGHEAVDLSFESKHVYRLELETVRTNFVIKVWDETSGPANRSLWKEIRVEGELVPRIGSEQIHQ